MIVRETKIYTLIMWGTTQLLAHPGCDMLFVDRFLVMNYLLANQNTCYITTDIHKQQFIKQNIHFVNFKCTQTNSSV